MPRPMTRAAARVIALSRAVRWEDARWAPSAGTGNLLASSLPERRAWGQATVGGAAGAGRGSGRRARHRGRGARAMRGRGGGRADVGDLRGDSTGSCRGGGELFGCPCLSGAGPGGLRGSMPAMSTAGSLVDGATWDLRSLPAGAASTADRGDRRAGQGHEIGRGQLEL